MSFEEIKKKATEAATKAKEAASTLADEAMQKVSEVDVDKLKSQVSDVADIAKEASKNIDVDDLKKKGGKLTDAAATAARETASEVEKGGLVPFLKTKKGMAIAAGAVIVLFMVFGGGNDTNNADKSASSTVTETKTQKNDASNGNWDVASSGKWDLRFAMNNGKCDKAKFLIENGFDLKSFNHMEEALSSRCGPALVNLLFDKGVELPKNSKKNFIQYAVREQHRNDKVALEIVKILLNKGVKINDHSLIAAISSFNFETAKFLIENGADVNAIYGGRGSNKNSALIIASSRDNLEIVKILIEKGANVNHSNQYGSTPLSEAKRTAVQYPKTQMIVKFLIDNGAKISDKMAEKTEKKAERAKKYKEVINKELKGKTYRAVLGCKDTVNDRSLDILHCAESVKVNDRFKYSNSHAFQKNYHAEYHTLTIGLDRTFHLTVKGRKGTKYYVKIYNISTEEEVFSEEKVQDKYGNNSILFSLKVGR